MKISVCIPTYNRPKTLQEAVWSCINQTHLPEEIIISDDSNSDDTEKWVSGFSSNSIVKIRYFRNRPALRQVGNVNQLFKYAENDLLILLHDDDLLMPGAIQSLFNCFLQYPDIDAAFGKQYLMSDSGIVDEEGSVRLNQVFYRTQTFQGLKLSSLESGFLQQFPNDGYLIKSNKAREISYREEAGDACDFDFALRLGIQNLKLFFLDEYTAKYRMSKDAINKKSNNNAGVLSFKYVEELKVPAESMSYKNKWLREKAPVAIADATNIRSYADAAHIYFSKWHRDKIITPGGIKRLLRIVLFAIIRPGQKGFLLS
jgi:glycosyltransferase involved in cell wall biosynthesis